MGAGRGGLGRQHWSRACLGWEWLGSESGAGPGLPDRTGVIKVMLMPGLTDTTTTLADIKTRVLAFARERDWEQFHAPKNLSMALAAEAAELMEHFLWAAPDASRSIAEQPAKRAKIEEELADVVIYALEFANMTGIDVAAAIERKMAANATKYPVEKARGRAEKYTDL
jgi:dCTP diphosphatase